MYSYQFFQSEQLFALVRQPMRQHSNLPSRLVSADFYPQRASDDLVSKAHANETYSVVGKHLLRELDESQDPRVVVEGVVFCTRTTIESARAFQQVSYPMRSQHTASRQEHGIHIL